ncbi:hypothetical protein D9619_002862 [Psilocybe cf. subviscida]|uniref:Homeodomain mating-type protein n=1 Tax=Psilocybe cf. subviscida TaxID=2480587 RepID=A0A8H5AWB2_9AGAR|nr:hypothetical protein D9619_002862 [Psilocybe cf. subviscida]
MRLPSLTTHPRDKPLSSTPSLHSRLLLADETSLSIFEGDTAAIEELCEFWTDIQVSLDEAIENGTASTEILALASKIARRTEDMTDKLISLYQEVEGLHASFSNMRTLFHELSLEDKPLPKTPVKQDPTKAFPLPAYIKPAYEWLLDNLHNPYPSKEVKRNISAETNTSISYIENWFTDVRRKIGWTTLSKERFYNKRSLIVEAATRTFHPASATLNCLPSTSEDFDSVFHQIADNAKNLYVDKLYETNLAVKVVESPSTDLSSLAELESRSRRSTSTFSPSPSSSYPSPQPEESQQTLSRKRRSTRSPDMEDISTRSHKRTRYASPQETSCHTPTSVPSPSLSVVEILSTVAEASPRLTLIPSSSLAKQGKRKRQASDEIDQTELPTLSSIRGNSIPISNSVKRKRVLSDSDDTPSTPPAAPSAPSAITPSQSHTRKRRLSDATGERPSKRPHNVPSAPRLQTVSDPYPISKPTNSPYGFDDWWTTSIASGQPITLGLPEPVTTEPIALDDSSTSFDIAWDSGVVIPPIASSSKEKSWTDFLQDGVGEIDSVFTNFLDHKAFEQQYNADLFSQGIDQNLLGLDSISNPNYFTLDNFQGASQNLGFASSQPDLGALPQFYNTSTSFSLPNPTHLLQSLHEPATAPAQHPYDAVITPEDKFAKAARIQRLREELQRLEAEVV